MGRGLVAAVALLAAACATPVAHAADSFTGPATDTLREASCRALYIGTANAPDPFPHSDFPSDPAPSLWPKAPAGLLPRQVYLRNTRDTFNARYEFATRGGQIYVAPRDGEAPGWRRLPLPPCFSGRVTAISADDDELIAIDEGRRIYTMDNALKGAALFNWTSRWGPTTWFGLGRRLPAGITTWSWSVISPAEDRTWTDPAGNVHAAGNFKDSHIWALSGRGQRLTLMDPWLPDDESYAMCGPLRGRFRAVNLSASGSTIFVIGAHGDLFTRLFDFDMSGSDPLFVSYSYAPQPRGEANAPVQLPPAAWIRQPKVPGRITSAISIEKTGTGALHRTLRVEGLDAAGRTGYWERDSAAPSAAGWTFHATGMPLQGRPLPNPQRETAALGAGRAADIAYSGSDGDIRISVPDFNVHCSPARLVVKLADGSRVALRLHSADGLRQAPRAPDLDDVAREQYGTIEVPPTLLAHLATQPPSVQDFLHRALGARRFTPVTLEATSTTLRFTELGWTLAR